MNNFPKIQTPRLLLRQVIESDLENLFKGLSHPEVIKYYGVSFTTLEETKEQLKFYKDLELDGTGIFWAVCSADNKTFYGVGGFNNLSKEHQKAEIGFWLLPEFWGQGIMQEGMNAMCEYAFQEMNLHRIEGFVESENEICKKAISKVHFQYEGTMKECEIKNGKFISLDIFARLKN